MGLVVEDIYGPQVEDQESTNVYEYNETPENRSWAGALPVKQGLYDPDNEKDACGVGFAAYVFHESDIGSKTDWVNSHIKGASKPQNHQRW